MSNKHNLPNRDQILNTLARHLMKQNKEATSADELLANQQQFVNQIKSTRINWKSVADELQCTREYVYHWYHETFLRSLSGANKIDKDDKKKIKDAIIDEIKTNQYLQPNMQQRVRHKVFGERDINRSEFNIIYNNIKRSKEVQGVVQSKGITLSRAKASTIQNPIYSQSGIERNQPVDIYHSQPDLRMIAQNDPITYLNYNNSNFVTNPEMNYFQTDRSDYINQNSLDSYGLSKIFTHFQGK